MIALGLLLPQRPELVDKGPGEIGRLLRVVKRGLEARPNQRETWTKGRRSPEESCPIAGESVLQFPDGNATSES